MRIEMALISGGAIGIAKDYGPSGELLAISFSVPSSGQRLVSVRLPGNVQEVENVFLSRLKRRPTKSSAERIRAQAARTGWKLVQDWVEVQMALIKMKQAEFLQVFLPYVWDGRQTFYESLKENNFRLLGQGKPEKK